MLAIPTAAPRLATQHANVAVEFLDAIRMAHSE